MSTTNTYNHSQMHLYNQFSAYLQQIGAAEGQVRENNLNLGGDCTGWSFLFSYYKSINKLEDFNHIKTYISKWDGQLSSLKTNVGMSESLKNKYPTGQKLFEQTINDVVWFSQIKSKNIANLSQNDRLEQYEFVKEKHFELKKIFSFLKKDHTEISMVELPELLKMAQLWKNSWLDLGIFGKNAKNKIEGHALSIYIDSESNLHFFDCNNKSICNNSTSAEEISTHIFEEISKKLKWNDLTLNDFSLYQFVPKKQSSNLNVESEIIDGELNVNKDIKIKFLEMALKSHQIEPVYKILSSEKQNNSEFIKLHETTLFNEAQKVEHTKMLDLLLKHNPSLSNNDISFGVISNFFNKLSINDFLNFYQNDILLDYNKNAGIIYPQETVSENVHINPLLNIEINSDFSIF